MEKRKIVISEKDKSVFDSIEYDPCIAVMAVLKQATDIPTGGIILENQAVAWIADNFQKGIFPRINTCIYHWFWQNLIAF